MATTIATIVSYLTTELVEYKVIPRADRQDLHLTFQDRKPEELLISVYKKDKSIDDLTDTKSGIHVPSMNKHMKHGEVVELAIWIRDNTEFAYTRPRCHLCNQTLRRESCDDAPCYWEDKEVHAQCCRKKQGCLLPIRDLKLLLTAAEYQSLKTIQWFVLQNVGTCPRLRLRVNESDRFDYLYICGESFDFLDSGKVRTQLHFLEWLETALDSRPVSLQWYTHRGDSEDTAQWCTREDLTSCQETSRPVKKQKV